MAGVELLLIDGHPYPEEIRQLGSFIPQGELSRLAAVEHVLQRSMAAFKK